MIDLVRFLPFRDLADHRPSGIIKDIFAALAVTFMAVPQGFAYAVIAGLPPAMGLYAGVAPAFVGSLFRSSRHVSTGPTNAVSLLVGGAVVAMAATGADPMTVGITLALMVGVFQVLAGVLKLGAIVDFISNPVVLGYITGAGLLIGIGQLHNVTETTKGMGNVFEKIGVWASDAGGASPMAVAMAVGTIVVVVGLRKINRKIPSAIIALAIATGLTYFLDLGSTITTASDLAPVPTGLPPLTIPDFAMTTRMVPLALAVTVLSLVESSAVARSLAATTGQRIDTTAEFAGQGLANIAASFFGAYPTSASPSRSALNLQAGARSRMAGIYAGFMMIAVLLALGPVVNYTPTSALAGLLVLVAYDLVNVPRIKQTMLSDWGDRLAFIVTLAGTWIMTLDKAIYLGVAISLVMFLQKVRKLAVQHVGVGPSDRLREVAGPEDNVRLCESVRVIQVEGRIFFGAAGALQDELDQAVLNKQNRVIVLRMRRTQGMDVTVATILGAAATRLKIEGRHLVLTGVRPASFDLMERVGTVEAIGESNIFAAQPQWFGATDGGIRHALTLADRHTCERCPLDDYLEGRARQQTDPS